MFLFEEVKYQVSRNRGRTLLLVCIAAFLAGCAAFYLGNIQSNESALTELGGKIPVTVKAMSPDGAHSQNLFLTAEKIDGIAAGGVREERRVSFAAGALSAEAREQDPFYGGDVSILAVNCPEAAGLTESDIQYETTENHTIFESEQPACVLNQTWAEENRYDVGDEISLPVYLHLFGSEYQLIGEDLTVRVAAIYNSETASAPMLVSEKWLRKETENAGLKLFCYDSYSAVVADPLKLNSFKSHMKELGILEINPATSDTYGEAAIIEDELFTKSAEKLRQNVAVYRGLLPVFFGVMIALALLTVFFTLRSGRKDLAIAVSLGRPKWKSALASFLAVLLADALGCVLALPVMCLAAGIPLMGSLAVCGVFLLCAGIGTAAALTLLLRFDAIELLTNVD